MKKFILISIAILSLSFVNAQLSIAPAAGFGHSWYVNDDVSVATLDYEFHPHMNVGVEFLYGFSSPWGVSLGIKYSGEGSTYNYMSSGTKIKSKSRASYVRLPVQLHYFFGDAGKSVRPTVALGPSFGFLTGGTHTRFENEVEVLKMDVKDYMESFDFGLNGSLGVSFKVGQSAWLSTVANYYHGLSNMYSNTTFDVEGRNIGLNVALRLPIGGATTTRTTTTQ